MLQQRGDLGGAEPLLRHALEIREESLGERHPDVGASFSLLGRLLNERGDRNAAESLVKQAVEIRRPIFGDRHPDVASDLAVLRAIGGSDAARGSPPAGTRGRPGTAGRAAQRLGLPAGCSGPGGPAAVGPRSDTREGRRRRPEIRAVRPADATDPADAG